MAEAEAKAVASEPAAAVAGESIRFHRSLYSREAIDEAVRAFADLATIRLTENAEDFQVHIEQPRANVAAVLADELANFALAETVARTRTVTR